VTKWLLVIVSFLALQQTIVTEKLYFSVLRNNVLLIHLHKLYDYVSSEFRTEPEYKDS